MSSCFTISLSLLLFFFFISFPSTESQPTYLYHYCPNATLFTPNSTYQSNLNTLLSNLSSAAAAAANTDGFANATAGQNPPDRAYGLFLCRADVSASTCSDCVAAGTKDILQRCPVQRVSVIWYDECMLRYSNQSIYSVMAQAPAFKMWNTGNITDPVKFVQVLSDAITDVAMKASVGESGKKVAVREANFTSLQTLYTLAQCTPDLTAWDCNTCLRSVIPDLPEGKQGGRIYNPSCTVRFELYPFYNISALLAPPPPPVTTSGGPLPPPVTTPEGSISKSLRIVVAVASSAVLMVMVIVSVFCFIRRRRRKVSSENAARRPTMAPVDSKFESQGTTIPTPARPANLTDANGGEMSTSSVHGSSPASTNEAQDGSTQTVSWLINDM